MRSSVAAAIAEAKGESTAQAMDAARGKDCSKGVRGGPVMVGADTLSEQK